MQRSVLVWFKEDCPPDATLEPRPEMYVENPSVKGGLGQCSWVGFIKRQVSCYVWRVGRSKTMQSCMGHDKGFGIDPKGTGKPKGGLSRGAI